MIQSIWDKVKNMETFWTVVSGVLVFMLGQLFVEFFLRPIQEYKELKAKIAYVTTTEACYFSNPRTIGRQEGFDVDEWKRTSLKLREIAAEVDAFVQTRPKYNRFIASKKALIEIKSCLMGLSNGCIQSSTDGDMVRANYKREKTIEYFLQHNKLPKQKEQE